MSSSRPQQIGAFGKVRLLLWKNFLIQIRHKFHTVIDLLLPIGLFSLLIWIHTKVGRMDHKQEIFQSRPLDNSFFLTGRLVYYSPNNPIFYKLMTDVNDTLKTINVIGVENVNELEDELAQNQSIAIDFHHLSNETKLPEKLSYSLRFPSKLRFCLADFEECTWQTNRLFLKNPFVDSPIDGSQLTINKYYQEGFLQIQQAIAQSYAINIDPTKNIPPISMHQFPNTARNGNLFTESVAILIPVLFLISFNYAFINSVRYIAHEKEKQLKEAMKIMGLANWMQHLSWFVRAMVMLLIPIIIITVVFTVPFGDAGAIYPNSDFTCLFVLFIGFALCLITLGFFVSSFFSRTRSATIAASVLWYLTTAPFYVTNSYYDDLAGWLKIIFCFLPNSALSYGFIIIGRWEYMGTGLNWTTAFQHVSVYENLTIASIFGFLIGDAILLFLITVYVEQVFPGKYGVAKPWNFLFTSNFWRNNKNDTENPFTIQTRMDQLNFETEPTNLKVGIRIQNLTKKFTNDKAAVDNLSLNIFENQITCLLGQNGAGKTTTISMLTGMLEPSSGTAFVNGFSIRTKMDRARDSMGFCPQHNILFDDLTVREHIQFYSCLKGLSNKAAEAEVEKYVPMLDLKGKINALSSTLSVGMKRKLSVVIALCGKSKVVFLDEPTSGMDPGARRALWDILLAEKKDRAILLTTHFMDEADVLSDRIAILANGDLKCAGSSFFLKKRFGTGYHLICVKGTNCDSTSITQQLQMYIPDIQIESETDNEISYILPEDKTDSFHTIFDDLEQNESRLNLQSFGVSLTTLEEIFLKIANSANGNSAYQNGHAPALVYDSDSILQGVSLLLSQAGALFKKRILCWMRSWLSFTCYNLFAVIMLCLVIFQIGSQSPNSGLGQSPPLEYSLDQYKSPFAILPNTAASS